MYGVRQGVKGLLIHMDFQLIAPFIGKVIVSLFNHSGAFVISQVTISYVETFVDSILAHWPVYISLCQ